MKRKSILGLILLLVSIPLANKIDAAERAIKEKRKLSSFKSITINGVGNIYIKQGNKEALTLEGNSNLLSDIKSEVKDGHLFLSQKHTLPNNKKPVNYYLTVKEIKNINASGNLVILTRNTLVSPELNVNINGSSKLHIKTKADKFNVHIAGNGNVKAFGNALANSVKIEGEGEFNGKKLSVDKAAVNIKGPGTAVINASQLLDVKIQGMGKVQYFGIPQIVEEISGAGEIIPL